MALGSHKEPQRHNFIHIPGNLHLSLLLLTPVLFLFSMSAQIFRYHAQNM